VPAGSTSRSQQRAQFAAVEPDPATLAAAVEDERLLLGAVDTEQGALVTRAVAAFLVLLGAETACGQRPDFGPAQGGQGVEFTGVEPHTATTGTTVDRDAGQGLGLELDVLAFRAGHGESLPGPNTGVKVVFFFQSWQLPPSPVRV
jgi:hypothetical protein